MPSFRGHLSLFLSTNIEEKYHNTFCLLSTLLKICGQNVDKQLILTIFYVDKILAKPHKISYLPWHCLYFFPEPHDYALLVYIVHVALLLLLLFQWISGSATFSIYGIYSTIVTIVIYILHTFCKHCLHNYFSPS